MRKRRRPNERFTAKQVQHPHWQSDRKAQESRCIQFGRPDQQRNASQERGEMANPYRVLWGAVENVVTGVCGIPGAANYTEPLHWDAGGHIRGIGHLLDARIKRTVRWCLALTRFPQSSPPGWWSWCYRPLQRWIAACGFSFHLAVSLCTCLRRAHLPQC